MKVRPGSPEPVNRENGGGRAHEQNGAADALADRPSNGEANANRYAGEEQIALEPAVGVHALAVLAGRHASNAHIRSDTKRASW